jgi:peptidoglycan/LPS O-acetylase OafA/YrhL
MPNTLISSSKTVQAPTTAARIPALDFTKGVLVLFMVLYHWLNYFYSPTGDFYRYLRFLTPSFIFITGFLISHVYFAKYGLASSQVSKRLAMRGLKILGVFLLLNGAIAILPGSPTRSILAGNSVIANLIAIFITGNVSTESGKIVAFGILVPISYLLLISALMSIICKYFRHIFESVCIGMFFCIFSLQLLGIQSAYLEDLAIGSLGVVLGYTSSTGIRKLVSHPYVLGLAYCAFLGAITIWDVPFALRVIDVCLTLLVIYAVGDRSQKPAVLLRHVIVLGRYSLFGYIWQIAILQLLHRFLGHGALGVTGLSASFVAGFAFTMAGVEAVDRLRPRWQALDQVYRYAFA